MEDMDWVIAQYGGHRVGMDPWALQTLSSIRSAMFFEWSARLKEYGTNVLKVSSGLSADAGACGNVLASGWWHGLVLVLGTMHFVHIILL